MNILNDLIYFTYIDTENENVLKQMYIENPDMFASHLNQIFDIEYRNKLAELVGEPIIADPDGTQKELQAIFTEIAHHLHFMMSSSGREFWHSRGVTDTQIVEYQLGDNWIWLPDEDNHFPTIGDKHYFTKLAQKYRPYLVKNVLKAMWDQINTAQTLYGSGHAVCCPSFNKDHVCTGIVFRNISYKSVDGEYKHMYKFFNPFSWSYIFNYETYQAYDELILVEGVFDALALKRAGYANVISPSMVRLSPYQVSLLKNKKLHVIFDHDRGGLEGLKFIKDKMGSDSNLITLALLPTERDFDEMTQKEIDEIMEHISEYDVRNLTSKPVKKHRIEKV